MAAETRERTLLPELGEGWACGGWVGCLGGLALWGDMRREMQHKKVPLLFHSPVTSWSVPLPESGWVTEAMGEVISRSSRAEGGSG